MKKTLILGLALALIGGVAYANLCARDVVPAATLLVPYAAVDLNADGTPNANGYTTLFAVTNVSSAIQLVHFTVWSAVSNHVVDWDEVLTGYDVWTINFRDLLTGHFDYFDTGSPLDPVPVAGVPPYGPTSNSYTTALTPPVDVPASYPAAWGSCYFPYGYRPTLGPIIVSKLQTDQVAQTLEKVSDCKTGVANFATPAWLSGLAKAPVFFYVTADAVSACSTAFPDQSTYWNGNSGGRYPVANNVLIGDVIWVNQTQNYSESMPAVHIEANAALRSASILSFYDRYATAATPAAQDDREPLATAFGFRYMNANGISTQAMVWKDHSEANYTATGTVNACVPYLYYAFDENENASARGGGGPSGFDVAEPNVIPFETQSVPVNATTWDGIPALNGWMMLVFDPSIPGASSTSVHQAWVGVRYLSTNLANPLQQYSTSLEAATLANANCFTDQKLPALGINYQYLVGGTLNFPQANGYTQ